MIKPIFFTLLLHFLVKSSYGQFLIPYNNHFDSPSDTLGWNHYAISGIDDWELGVPNDTYFSVAYSLPNAWVTDLDNNYAINSERILETPTFDLSDTTINYALSFYQSRKHNTGTGNYYYLEYSLNNGITWQLLNGASMPSKNWQTTSGFTNNTGFVNSAFRLRFIQGNSSVKFRYRYITNSSPGEGWMIDNFSIAQEYFNIYANQGDSIFVTQNCTDFSVKSVFGFNNQYSNSIYNTTQYYLSENTVLDAQDTLLFSKSLNISNSNSNFTQTIPMIPNLSPGYYYIIYYHDALDTLTENNENDNISYAVMKVDSVFNLPYIEDFELNNFWKPYIESPAQLVWEKGEGSLHHINGSHSGKNAWHTSQSINCSGTCGVQYVESPYFDLTTSLGSIVLNTWFKTKEYYVIQYNSGCDQNWYNLSTFQKCRDNEWDFINIPLNSLSSEKSIKFRFKYTGNTPGIIFDDTYIGEIKPDLSIERDKLNRYTPTSNNIDTLKYFLNNNGLTSSPSTTTSFYWSNDSIFDASDILLGTKQEQVLTDTARLWTTFIYSKPTTVASKYYIFYFLDINNTVNEMREYNNDGVFVIYQNDQINTPYFNDFENQTDHWRHNTSLGNDDWQWTVPNAPILNSAFSGTKAWVTNGNGLASPISRMHLYTPIFDLSTLSNPVLEFDIKSLVHSINQDNGGNISYSTDQGATWKILDTTNQSYKCFYYPMEYDGGFDFNYIPVNSTSYLFDVTELSFFNFNQYHSRDTKNNTRFIIDLSFLSNSSSVQFRVNYGSFISPSEGILLDNFMIREAFVDLDVDYTKTLLISPFSQKIKFFMHIQNQGNYISNQHISKFYLSSDTLLDGSDFFLGQENIPEIRPDMWFYLNSIFNAPVNLSSFNYLLYELDATNTNIEINETNNVGYWPLGLGGIQGFPYYNDFNDTIINGWNHYVYDRFGQHMKNRYRFRNIIAPGEPLYQTNIVSGEMFTERINNTLSMSSVPYWYLESPSFNFSQLDSILLSFDLLCIGRTNSSDGGNLQFSTDGGNTWSVLTSSLGQSHNWYNYSSLSDLNNEPGWAVLTVPYLDSTFFNLSFLSGEENVVFRFKYRGNLAFAGGGTVQGMRIDNFKINGIPTSSTDIKDNNKDYINIYTSNEDIFIRSININNSKYTLNLFSSSGSIVYQTEINLISGLEKIPIPKHLANGIYIISIQNNDHFIVEKFIKY